MVNDRWGNTTVSATQHLPACSGRCWCPSKPLPCLCQANGTGLEEAPTSAFQACLAPFLARLSLTALCCRQRTHHGGTYLCEYDPTCKFDHPFAVTQGFGKSFGCKRSRSLPLRSFDFKVKAAAQITGWRKSTPQSGAIGTWSTG